MKREYAEPSSTPSPPRKPPALTAKSLVTIAIELGQESIESFLAVNEDRATEGFGAPETWSIARMCKSDVSNFHQAFPRDIVADQKCLSEAWRTNDWPAQVALLVQEVAGETSLEKSIARISSSSLKPYELAYAVRNLNNLKRSLVPGSREYRQYTCAKKEFPERYTLSALIESLRYLRDATPAQRFHRLINWQAQYTSVMGKTLSDYAQLIENPHDLCTGNSGLYQLEEVKSHCGGPELPEKVTTSVLAWLLQDAPDQPYWPIRNDCVDLEYDENHLQYFFKKCSDIYPRFFNPVTAVENEQAQMQRFRLAVQYSPLLSYVAGDVVFFCDNIDKFVVFRFALSYAHHRMLSGDQANWDKFAAAYLYWGLNMARRDVVFFAPIILIARQAGERECSCDFCYGHYLVENDNCMGRAPGPGGSCGSGRKNCQVHCRYCFAIKRGPECWHFCHCGKELLCDVHCPACGADDSDCVCCFICALPGRRPSSIFECGCCQECRSVEGECVCDSDHET